MTPGDVLALLFALGLVLAAAWFSAAETAFGRLTLAAAQRTAEDGSRASRRVVALLQEAPRTLSTLALLVLVCQVTGVAVVTVVLARFVANPVAVGLAAVSTSVALFVGAGIAPRTLAVQRTEAVARATAWSVRLLATLLRPVTSVMIWAGNVLAPGRGLADGPFVTEDAIRDLIDEAEEEVIEKSEREMIHSIFELGDTLVREIMVPRPDVVMVSTGDSLTDVVDVIIRRGFSRLPVYAADDRDEIAGLLYAKDVLRRLHGGGGEDEPWDGLLRPPYVVPELKSVDELLRELQAEQVHLAVVVDEYGAIVGIVTIEDILEEIVGEIVDEYDREEALVDALDDDRWRVDARLPVDELDALVDAELPDEEWDTVGGLLFGLLGHVPRAGESVEVDGLRLTAERVAGRRIAKVLVERLAPTPVEEPEPDPAAPSARG